MATSYAYQSEYSDCEDGGIALLDAAPSSIYLVKDNTLQTAQVAENKEIVLIKGTLSVSF